MNATKKKVDRWLRKHAGDYGFVLPLKMTNERHHWEYIGVDETKDMDTYVKFDIPQKDKRGYDKAIKAPTKDESFSLRRINENNRLRLYMLKEKD